MSAAFVDAFRTIGGLVVTQRRIAEGSRDLETVVDSLPVGVDLVFYGGSFEGAPLLKTLRQRNINHLFATGDGCWDLHGFLEPAGEAATRGEGVTVLAASLNVGSTPGSTDFANRYRRRFGPIGNYALNAYDAARLLLLAIERALDDAEGSRSTVIDAMRSIDWQGISSRRPARWDGRGENRSAATVLNVIVDGCFRTIAEFDS